MVTGATLTVEEIRERLGLKSFQEHSAEARTQMDTKRAMFRDDEQFNRNRDRGAGYTTEMILRGLAEVSAGKTVHFVGVTMNHADMILKQAQQWALQLEFNPKQMKASSLSSNIRGSSAVFMIDHFAVASGESYYSFVKELEMAHVQYN